MASGFPKLELFFVTDEGRLKDAEFQASEGGILDRRFCQVQSADKLFVVELCIVILLSKIRGPNPDNPNQPIRFEEKIDRPSWLKALGVALTKETHKAFFELCFGNVNFIIGNRASGHNKRQENPDDELYAFAEYHPKELRLENVHICEYGDEKKVALSVSRLEDLIRELEKSGIESGYGWDSAVGEYIKEVKAARRLGSDDQGQPVATSKTLEVKISDPQNDLLLDISKQIASRRDKGTWYVLSSIPSYLGQWKRKFCNSILIRGSDVHYLHHRPLGPQGGTAKLWEGNADGKTAADLEQRVAEAIKELSKWVTEVKSDLEDERGAGEFEYGLTNVNLPYIAILFDPAASKKNKPPLGKAPIGAWCAVSLCSIDPAHVGEHRALYLENPSPLLDEYYTSIKRFFAKGAKQKEG